MTELWHSLLVLFSGERAVSSVLELRALLSACLVLCWSMVFGSRHSCLEFRFRVGVRTLALHVLSHCVSVRLEFARPRALLSMCVVCVCVARSSCFIGCVHSCYVLCCVARSSCFSLAACFHVVVSCVNTRLMSILISCVFVSCFAHGWWFALLAMCLRFVLCEHMAFVLVFCVPCALMSIVLTPPILLPDYWLICPTCVFLITLLICSLYNLLVFAVPCEFVVDVTLCEVLPCLALPCPASLFSPTG